MPRLGSSTPGWSADKKLWDHLDKLSRGLSWRKVEFSPSREGVVPSSEHGVYLICASPPAKTLDAVNAYTILYVGQQQGGTRSLRERFREHIDTPKPAFKAFVDSYFPAIDFWFAVVKDLATIDDLESILIETFNPPCNLARGRGAEVLLAHLGPPQPFRQSSRHR